MAILIENTLNEITYAGGLNTNKPATFGGTTTFNGSTIINEYYITNPVKNAINATATATAAQVAAGYITSTSAAATTITLPTGSSLGSYLGATQGIILNLFIDNTAGANTVTIAVNTNAILSDAAAAGSGAGFGELTVAAGATGLARFTLMFSSATAYVFSRTA